MTDDERMTDEERYLKATHAMQTGVVMELELGSFSGEPKHLRVGVNAALCDSAMIVKLLIAKGVVTKEEIGKASADEMELEVVRYENRLSEKLGRRITLA